jgi:two-component system, chemotaxis family, sensor kinase CheA
VDDLTKEFIAESQEGLERMERCLTELERRPDDGELVAEIFRSVHTIKGTTGFLGFGRLEALAHAGENLLGALREGKLVVTSGLISGLLDLMDGLRAILRLIEATGSEGLRASDDDHELIALLVELRGGRAGAALVCVESGVSTKQLENDRSVAAKAAAKAAVMAAVSAAVSSAHDKTVRINIEVLNRLMNLVGELVLTRNQILQSSPATENFPELARRLDTVTAELRESVMQARMQPVGHLFGKFPRMVRDLARTCGRQVRIEFEGKVTGLDKSLLEAIRDPLTHAVRNSVDHGIEPAEERVKAGKAAEGLVRLRALHQGGSVVIEVMDDGAGISVARVLATAVERRLVTAEQAEKMTEREALQLVFVAGFSTAKEVTNISGRGVGLDVVRANVERVGGSVELESRVGLGTTLRLRVPLTLAIVPALVVRSGGQSFALPQSSLMELVYVPRRDVAMAVETIGTAELYRLRGRLLPLVWLDRLLGLEQSVGADAIGLYIAVVESEGCRFGLVVDDLMAPEEIVVKPLSAVLRGIGVFSGATVLGNGMLAMILDVAATGARAGVRPVTEPERVVEVPGPVTRIEMESSMVIFEVRTGERMAMPLALVERIESVPVGEIEFAGGRAVLQHGGELLTLEDEGEVLRELGVTWGDDAARTRVPAPGQWITARWASSGGGAGADVVEAATVLICLRPGARGMRRAGVIVRRVLDITAGTMLAEDAEFAGRLAMVRDRVTTVHQEPAEQVDGPAAAILREVA